LNASFSTRRSGISLMNFPRASGILAHPTSFPGRYGIGDLGEGARQVIDFLAAGRQRLWQVLPLGPTGFGNSPYASLSTFAGNHNLIAPDQLIERGWLRADDVADVPAFAPERVDFGHAIAWKMTLLRQAHARFQAIASPARRDDLAAFVAANQHWLDDYTLFVALKQAQQGATWTAWPTDLVARRPAALAAARATLAGELRFQEFLQWTFATQWQALRAYARHRGVRIIGDVAIFVAHDSADVWAHPELFALDPQGWPTVVTGVPPDYFSRTGQRWGNPVYRWDVLAATGYAWWIERVRAALGQADRLRLDHFRGFHAAWEIPATSPTAEQGRWVPGPRAALFKALHNALGDLPLIAEDLGEITAAVRHLRERLGLPGMKVLQFAFSADARNQHLPHWYTHDTAVYTGTHDNDTMLGWLATRDPPERDFALRYAHSDGREPHWDFMRLALASVADTAIVPLQDILGLGSEARMNMPGTASGNWSWRCTHAQLSTDISARLAGLTSTYGR
jgi:4-alpha-glucanotransferase